jgi:NAD(P) transhydrogenase
VTERYDLIVIGGGPAGEKGAAQAAYFGKRVALVERANLGGAMVNTGTLPSKTLRETALYLSGFRQRGLYGLDYAFHRALTVDDLFYRERAVSQSYLDQVDRNMARHRIETVRGSASLEDAHTVRVERDGTATRLAAEVILIATGSRPHHPPGVPFDGALVHDSDSILAIRRIPQSLIVIGAGVIGSEYASVFGALGIDVTLIDPGHELLPFLDDEIAEVLLQQMRAMGVSVLFGRRVERFSPDAAAHCVSVHLDDGSALRADMALFCGGRSGNVEALGLERAGVTAGPRGHIKVNEHFQTSAASIYAVGDVIGFPALACTAMEEARVAVCHAFEFEYKQRMSQIVPYGLYTIPEVSMVGESEQSLLEQGRPYLVGRQSYGQNPRAQIIGDTSGLLKLLFDPESERLLGAHMIGERATELIHIAQACLYFEGTLDFFIQSVFNFPTLADLYKYAAYDGLQALERYRRKRQER